MRLFKYLSRNIHAVLRQKQKKAVDFSTAFFGAGEGTRTPTVSLLILSQARLPFRHTGITELL